MDKYEKNPAKKPRARSWDYIDFYIRLMGSITDAPVEFHEAAALFLVSTAIGRNFVFKSVPDVNLLDIKGSSGRMLNLWFIIIGKSRISRKSTVMRHAESFLEQIAPTLLLPQDFTPQALVSELAQKSNGTITPCVWVNDEISGFFQQIRDRTFMVTTDVVLSRLYDCRDYNRRTVGRDLESIPKPYLTVFLGSTEYLPSLFTDGGLRQGFLNRFIFVIGRRARRKPLLTELKNEEKKARVLHDWLEALFNRTTTTELAFSSDAEILYDDYEKWVEDRIENEEMGVNEGYWGNLPNFLIRISSVFRISRLTLSELKQGFSSLVVEQRDIERGLEYLDRVWIWFEEVIHLMKTTATSRVAETEEYKLEMVLSIIKGFSGPDGWTTRTEVLRRSQLTSRPLDELIKTLLDRGDIETDIRPPSPKGGPSTILYRVRRQPPSSTPVS